MLKKTIQIALGFVKIAILAFLMILLFNGLVLRPMLSAALGFYWDTDVSIRKAVIDWTLPGLVLKDISVGNPYGFPRGHALDIESAVLSMHSGSLEEGVLKPQSLNIIVRKIELMRRVSGHLNLALLAEPEGRRSAKGLKIAPAITRIEVKEIVEIDASSPLLSKSELSLENRVFVLEEGRSFAQIARAFVGELLKRAAVKKTADNGLRAPHYQGITAAVEQELREQAEEKAREAAEDEAAEVLISGSSST